MFVFDVAEIRDIVPKNLIIESTWYYLTFITSLKTRIFLRGIYTET